MAYDKQTWEDGIVGNTPVSAERLNYIEDGVDEAHTLIEELQDQIEAGGGDHPDSDHTTFQPSDPNLTAIANLDSAANKVPYSTGADAWALTNLTAYGRLLIALTDVTGLKTQLAASGTPDGTTYLRGDGTWATPATSGGAISVIAETVVPSGGAATIDFVSIPTTYRHLRLVVSGRLATGASAVQGVLVRLNNDSASNYWYSYLRGVNAAVSSGNVADTGVQVLMADAGAPASLPTAIDMTLPNYRSTFFFKKMLIHSSSHFNLSSNSYNEVLDGLWRSTSAVTRLTLVPPVNFAEGTVATLYGMNGA